MTRVCDHYSSPLMPRLFPAPMAQGLAFFPLAHIRLGNQRVFPSATHEMWHWDTNVCGKGTGSRDVRHSALSPLAVNDMTCGAEKPKNSFPFQSQRLWGTLLLRTLLNVLIGGPNELWPRSAICPPRQAYWPHADAYQNDECGIKFKWVGRSETGRK